MDDPVEKNNGQYMFASSIEMSSPARNAAYNLDFPNDDLATICQEAGLFDLTQNMDDMLFQLDAMEEVHRNETQHPVMAMPVKQKGIRKSTRKGARKRKVNFGETFNDQWQ